MYIQFGVGQAVANPNAGNLPALTTPVSFATLQGVDVSFDRTLKELKGQYQFADDVAPAESKITGKIATGRIDVYAFNQLFFADTTATGVKAVAVETDIIPTTPFTVTVVHSATWTVDLGVRYALTGAPLVQHVTPATGQYSVAAGVYTFAAADTGLGVVINYEYTVATGITLTVHNQLLGFGPIFELWLAEPYQGANGLHLFAVRAGKLNMPLKRDDYLISEIDFQAFPNASGQLAEFFDVVG